MMIQKSASFFTLSIIDIFAHVVSLISLQCSSNILNLKARSSSYTFYSIFLLAESANCCSQGSYLSFSAIQIYNPSDSDDGNYQVYLTLLPNKLCKSFQLIHSLKLILDATIHHHQDLHFILLFLLIPFMLNQEELLPPLIFKRQFFDDIFCKQKKPRSINNIYSNIPCFQDLHQNQHCYSKNHKLKQQGTDPTMRLKQWRQFYRQQLLPHFQQHMCLNHQYQMLDYQPSHCSIWESKKINFTEHPNINCSRQVQELRICQPYNQ